MSKQTFHIKTWMGRILFDGKTFDSFEDGWAHIYEVDPLPPEDHEDYDHYYDDYYVEEVKEDS